MIKGVKAEACTATVIFLDGTSETAKITFSQFPTGGDCPSCSGFEATVSFQGVQGCDAGPSIDASDDAHQDARDAYAE